MAQSQAVCLGSDSKADLGRAIDGLPGASLACAERIVRDQGCVPVPTPKFSRIARTRPWSGCLDERLADERIRRRPSSVTLAVDFQLSLESEGVGSAYPDQPLATTVEATVGDALKLLRAQRTGAVLICEGLKLVGILTERDALKLMASGADMSTSVREVMSSPPATIPATATVGEAIRTMSEGGYRHLPMVDDAGRPTGVVAVHGIVHYLVDHFPSTVYNLPPNPKASTKEREGA